MSLPWAFLFSLLQVARRAFRSLQNAAPRPPAFLSFLPPPPQPMIPVLIPAAASAAAPAEQPAEPPRSSSAGGATTASRAAALASAAASQLRGARPVFVPAETAIDAAAPKLTQAEELYAQSLTDLVRTYPWIDRHTLCTLQSTFLLKCQSLVSPASEFPCFLFLLASRSCRRRSAWTSAGSSTARAPPPWRRW